MRQVLNLLSELAIRDRSQTCVAFGVKQGLNKWPLTPLPKFAFGSSLLLAINQRPWAKNENLLHSVRFWQLRCIFP